MFKGHYFLLQFIFCCSKYSLYLLLILSSYVWYDRFCLYIMLVLKKKTEEGGKKRRRSTVPRWRCCHYVPFSSLFMKTLELSCFPRLLRHVGGGFPGNREATTNGSLYQVSKIRRMTTRIVTHTRPISDGLFRKKRR